MLGRLLSALMGLRPAALPAIGGVLAHVRQRSYG
jgi:hypothetical protein